MKLKTKYSFWVSTQRTQPKIDEQNYNSNLHKVAVFDNIDDFWHIYSYMARPSTIPEGCQLLMFQENIKPMWEDTNNQNGGRFLYRCRQGIDKMWENMLLSLIGNQSGINSHVCGIVSHQKRSFAQVSIWVKDISKLNQEEHEKLDQWIMNMFQVNSIQDLDFVAHPTS